MVTKTRKRRSPKPPVVVAPPEVEQVVTPEAKPVVETPPAPPVSLPVAPVKVKHVPFRAPWDWGLPERPPKKAATAIAAPKAVESLPPDDGSPKWLRSNGAKAKTTVRECIVVDHNLYWHDMTKVDLHGVDASAFTWGYYGKRYPVLVEKDGKLEPFFRPDAVGENPHFLYIMAKSAGYKGYMAINPDGLRKLLIGMMVVLIVAIFFFMYLLIQSNAKPPAEEAAMLINLARLV